MCTKLLDKGLFLGYTRIRLFFIYPLGGSMSLEAEIRRLHAEMNGDAKAVATALQISPSYVYRVLRDDETAIIPAPPTVEPSHALSLVDALIPPNVDGIADLRDLTMRRLKEKIEADTLPVKELLTILNLLLKHEGNTRAILSPSMSLIYSKSERTDHVDTKQLIDALADLPVEKLRALSGQPGAGEMVLDG